MKASWNWKTIAGWVLHGLVGGIMILAGSAKVFGLFPPEEVAKLGLSLPIQVIGAGELASAILLLIPRTSSLGLLLTSGFWGGGHLSAHVKGRAVRAAVRLPADYLGWRLSPRSRSIRQLYYPERVEAGAQ